MAAISSRMADRRSLWRAFSAAFMSSLIRSFRLNGQYIFLGSIWLRNRLKCRLMAADFLRLRSAVGFS